jgi:hypothetical protein
VEITAEGTKVYGGKQKVEAKEKELTKEHFGKNRERWYRNAQGAVLPQFRSTRQTRETISVGRSFANSSDFQKSPLRTRRTPSARCMAEHNV